MAKKNKCLFLKKDFKVVSVLEILKKIKIFNFSFINERKEIEIVNTFEKFKPMIQAYNTYNKMSILTKLVIF